MSSTCELPVNSAQTAINHCCLLMHQMFVLNGVSRRLAASCGGVKRRNTATLLYHNDGVTAPCCTGVSGVPPMRTTSVTHFPVRRVHRCADVWGLCHDAGLLRRCSVYVGSETGRQRSLVRHFPSQWRRRMLPEYRMRDTDRWRRRRAFPSPEIAF